MDVVIKNGFEPEGEQPPLFFYSYEKMYNYICRFIPAELQE